MDANSEQQLRDALGQIELATIAEAMQSQGLPPNNLASAAAYWLIANYEIIRDESISEAQTRAVFEQMQQRIASDPDNADLTDAEKQQTAESTIWIATLQYMHYMEARNNTPGNDMRAVKADARQSLQQYGINADRMQLTAQGLILR